MVPDQRFTWPGSALPGAGQSPERGKGPSFDSWSLGRFDPKEITCIQNNPPPLMQPCPSHGVYCEFPNAKKARFPIGQFRLFKKGDCFLRALSHSLSPVRRLLFGRDSPPLRQPANDGLNRACDSSVITGKSYSDNSAEDPCQPDCSTGRAPAGGEHP